MRAVKLGKQDLSVFIRSLRSFGELWGSVQNREQFILGKIEDFSDGSKCK